MAITLLVLLDCNALQGLATSAPPTPTPTASLPLELAGIYDCTGTENGLLVGTGSFTLRPDGVIVDELSGQSGLWTYHPDKKELAIAGDLDVQRAIFHPENGRMEFYLREGRSRAHVSDGILNCSRRPE